MTGYRAREMESHIFAWINLAEMLRRKGMLQSDR
jgi:hypothetical protein